MATTYAEKLKDPRWQKKRLEILQRDNWTCQECLDKTATLHIHHLDYERGVEPWGYPEYYYITLCEKCHKEIEAKRKSFEETLAKRFRLHLKTEFSIFCVEDVLGRYDLDRLFFLLHELDTKKVMWWLERENSKQLMKYQNECFSNDKAVETGCMACGGDMRYYKNIGGARCTTCGYEILFSKKKIAELNGQPLP